MPLDLDPIFHTEAMLKILRNQGSTLHAMELAEKILEKEPNNENVRKILNELKAETKEAFERFRKGKKLEEEEISEPSEEDFSSETGEKPTEVVEEPTESVVFSGEVEKKPDTREEKIKRLEKILENIEAHRKIHGTP